MSLRKTLFWTHLVVGMTFGLVILSMCTTGAMLAFELQIVPWVERGIRSVSQPNPSTARLNIETLLSRFAAASPDVIPTNVTWSSDPLASVSVRAGRQGTFYLNPFTGEVLGKSSKLQEFLDGVENWHRQLGSLKIGKSVTGAAALAFLGLALSGIYLWWPRTISLKNALTWRWNLNGKARDWNWHTVTGFWLSIYIVMLSSTGIIMSYTWASDLLYTLSGNKPPVRQERPAERKNSSEKPTMPAFEGLNVSLDIATQQVPGWKSLMLRIPQDLDAPVSFFILHEGLGWAGARSQLVLDRMTGDVLKWEPYSENNTGRKLRIWTTQLHTGRALGWFGALLNFTTAVGGLLLVWTGFALVYRRFINWRKAR